MKARKNIIEKDHDSQCELLFPSWLLVLEYMDSHWKIKNFKSPHILTEKKRKGGILNMEDNYNESIFF